MENQMKIKVFFGSAGLFEEKINEWLKNHPHIEIKDQRFWEDWHGTNGLGIHFLQFYAVFTYVERETYYDPDIFKSGEYQDETI